MKNYERSGKIGQGSFGKIFKAKNRKNKQIVVLKEINLPGMRPASVKEAENEVFLLKTLDHPNLLKFIDAFKNRGKFPYIGVILLSFLILYGIVIFRKVIHCN
jgi:serine/threonine protein kinase